MSDDRPVVAYGVGIVSMSVCAQDDASRNAIESYANANYPTGIQSRWEIAADPEFADGTPHPAPCNHEDGRTHYLLHC